MDPKEYEASFQHLLGLTGPERRAAYLQSLAADREEWRHARRLPTRHARVICDLQIAQLLPAPGPDVDEAERRGIRNKLKAMRRGRRA